jgi:3-hydroxyisobutyrate dehydrogenase-like beta-hydroxyacid dehydrogenase
MGAGMAQCLVRASYPLRVWNRSAEKMDALVEAGATGCASPADAVAGATLVISSLMDDASVRAIFNEDLLTKMAPNAIHVCTTTISPGCAEWLFAEHRAHGTRYVSGPVVGRPDAAVRGALLQFLSGDASAIEEARPVCKAFAPTQMTIPGPAGIANSQKLCVNFFVISLIEAMAECYTLAEKAGASPAILAEFFENALAHPAFKNYVRRLLNRDTAGAGGFSMRGGLKDVRLMLGAAKSADCPLDLAQVIEGKMVECITRGLGDADWSAIQEATRARAHLDAKSGASSS